MIPITSLARTMATTCRPISVVDADIVRTVAFASFGKMITVPTVSEHGVLILNEYVSWSPFKFEMGRRNYCDIRVYSLRDLGKKVAKLESARALMQQTIGAQVRVDEVYVTYRVCSVRQEFEF